MVNQSKIQTYIVYLYIYSAGFQNKHCQAHLLNQPLFAQTIYSHHKLSSYAIEKCVPGNLCQSHSRIGETVKFNLLAVPSWLYVGQEFVSFHHGIQLTEVSSSIQVLRDAQMHLICQIKQFLRVLTAALLNLTYTMKKELQVLEDCC